MTLLTDKLKKFLAFDDCDLNNEAWKSADEAAYKKYNRYSGCEEGAFVSGAEHESSRRAKVDEAYIQCVEALESTKAFLKVSNETLFALTLKTSDKNTRAVLGAEIEHQTREWNALKKALASLEKALEGKS